MKFFKFLLTFEDESLFSHSTEDYHSYWDVSYFHTLLTLPLFLTLTLFLSFFSPLHNVLTNKNTDCLENFYCSARSNRIYISNLFENTAPRFNRAEPDFWTKLLSTFRVFSLLENFFFYFISNETKIRFSYPYETTHNPRLDHNFHKRCSTCTVDICADFSNWATNSRAREKKKKHMRKEIYTWSSLLSIAYKSAATASREK